MKIVNKIISLILIWFVFTATASAYTISGYVTNNSAGINGTIINYNLNTTYSNATGYYFMNNLTGNIIINFTSNPVYYSNSTSINMDSNKTLNVNLLKKPTGTISGRVCSFPGCQIEEAVQIASNRIRWFF
uniref:Carboxypeptidase regulatory-like domain-containing protein n=1 Tax=viral metagenome TaxID=1070528 RepID=A0A6M3M7L9_9ZZZZ